MREAGRAAVKKRWEEVESSDEERRVYCYTASPLRSLGEWFLGCCRCFSGYYVALLDQVGWEGKDDVDMVRRSGRLLAVSGTLPVVDLKVIHLQRQLCSSK